MSLIAEFMGIDSEMDLFKKFPSTISSKIECSVYNRSRRELTNKLNNIRLKLASYFNKFEDYFIIDSMPLEVCELLRSYRSKICKDNGSAFLDKDC